MASVNDPGTLSAATVAIGQTVVAYAQFLPRLAEVRQSSKDDSTMRGDVLLGQVAAGSVSMSVGVMLSWLTGSAAPVYAVLGVAIIIAITYQIAMNGERVMET